MLDPYPDSLNPDPQNPDPLPCPLPILLFRSFVNFNVDLDLLPDVWLDPDPRLVGTAKHQKKLLIFERKIQLFKLEIFFLSYYMCAFYLDSLFKTLPIVQYFDLDIE